MSQDAIVFEKKGTLIKKMNIDQLVSIHSQNVSIHAVAGLGGTRVIAEMWGSDF